MRGFLRMTRNEGEVFTFFMINTMTSATRKKMIAAVPTEVRISIAVTTLSSPHVPKESPKLFFSNRASIELICVERMDELAHAFDHEIDSLLPLFLCRAS